MSKYLKLLLIHATYLVLSAFIVNAQNSESEESEAKEESEELKLSTRPQLLPNPNITSTDADLRLQIARFSNLSTSDAAIISNSGVSGTDIAALGSANVNSLIEKLDSTSSLSSAVQFKTLVEVVDAFSNAPVDTSTSGRRAVSPTADISTIVDSTVKNISTDHLLTLEKLDVSHMSTFATDGVANIENFTTRVDVTSAMVGDSLDTLDTSKISTLVDNLHIILDPDSLTALKSLEKSHMTTLVGSGDSKIDLTTSFDPSAIKKSVKKFATKAEVTVTFAKKAGGDDFSGVDLSVIATQIHASLDDDHLEALQNLSLDHMDAMMPDASELSAGLNVSHIAHVATKAEVVVEFAKASAGSTTLNDDGTLDFGTSFTATNMNAFVTTVHSNLDEDHTTALAKLDPIHMATMAAGTDFSAGLQADDLSHFATKGELASVYVDAGGASVDIASIVTKVHATITVEFTTSLKEFDPSHMATMATGVDITAIASVGHKAKVAHAYKDTAGTAANIDDILTNVGNIQADDLLHFAELDHTSLKSLAADVDISKVHEDAAHKAKAVAAGFTLEEALALEGDSLAALANSSKDDLIAAKESGKTLDDHASETHIAGTKNSEDADIDTAAKAVKTDAKGKDNSYTNAASTTATGFPKALESAVQVAELILTDRVINNDNDLADDLHVGTLAGNGYNSELIRILAKYGALGSKGGVLADAVLGADFIAFNKSIDLSTKVQPNTSAYQQFLSTLGARALGADKTNNNVFSVPTSNIKLSSGANITFNASAEIDSSEVLPKGDRRIAIIGAAKDMTIKGNLNIKNTNSEENGALVLGAADDFYFRSEYNTANNADYVNPNVVSITNEGANLALGSEDTMRLVNVSVSTGGNLAIGTLNELHIGTSTAQQNTLSVGTGGQNSDPDNIYLYAHNLIQVNGLNITGRVDDVYMEAVTINLRNVNFPNTSEVTLRSRDGTIGFNQFATPIIGGVNLTNVKHGATLLEQNSFNGGPGYWATNKSLPNGTPAVQIKKF